jgi:hypothetical protein
MDLEELSDEDLARIRKNYEKLARSARQEVKNGMADTGSPEVEDMSR